MQKDKKKRLGKVATELLKDPLLTTREIQKKTWISKSTVANYINNDLDTLGLKSDFVLQVTDNDKIIIQDAQFINMFALWKIKKSMEDDSNYLIELRDAKIVSDIARESTARYSLFKWNATDNNWGAKEIIIEM